tara:strand:+ start:3320 stop:4207 length:888 start_codon:yes stop_codon:yes gene_type:complete
MITFTQFNNKFARNGYEQKKTFNEFISWLDRDIRADKEGKLFAPAIFDGPRLKKNVQWITMLCFDVDDGTVYQLPQTNYKYIAYTTHSHTPAHHKWRLIFPLQKPIPAEHWRYAFQAANRFWHMLFDDSVGDIDKSCSDSSRMYYAPSCPSAERKNARFDYQDGENFDLVYDHIIRQQQDREAEFKRICEAKEKFKNKNKTRKTYYWELKRELQIEYATNENYRRHLAEIIGTVSGDKCEDFDCPVCGRSDATFFYLNPMNNSHRAYCAHMETCGTPGDYTKFSVYSLAAYNGLI